MKRCFVGFDTSNYTTSGAVCDEDGRVIANLRILLPVADGERGLRQSDALFAHVRNLPEICRGLRDAVRGYEVAAVGCSVSPRRAEDSYMPCFRAGRAAAEAFAASVDAPIHTFSHQEGHVMAALYSSGTMDSLLTSPFAAFHVSGGTTDVLSVTPLDVGFDAKTIGGSADLHAGQAVDRVGVMMGLSFPCGKEMERLALQNELPVPKPKISVADGFCHLSGLENLAAKLWKETQDAPLVSAFVFAFLAETLKELTASADALLGHLPIVYAGGVMSNRYLQSVLSARKDTYFAEPSFSADNAAGISLLTGRAQQRKESSDADRI